MKNKYILAVSVLAIIAAVFYLCSVIYYTVIGEAGNVLGVMWFCVIYAAAIAVFSLQAYGSNSKSLKTLVFVLLCIAGVVYLLIFFAANIAIAIPLIYVIVEIILAGLALKSKNEIQYNDGSNNSYASNANAASMQNDQVIIDNNASGSDQAELKDNTSNEVTDVENTIKDDK